MVNIHGRCQRILAYRQMLHGWHRELEVLVCRAWSRGWFVELGLEVLVCRAGGAGL